MSQLLAIGVSHQTAPLNLRAQIAFTARHAARFGTALLQREAFHEAVVLSTCNRTEIYVAANDGPTRPALTELAALLAYETQAEPAAVTDSAYFLAGQEVERHLYRVTAGLDSMVVGESEIQGQVKRTLEGALAAGSTGTLTSRLFSTALRTGKRVRSETRIGAKRTSVASVAVDLAIKAAGQLDQLEVTLVGAGDAGESAAKVLAARGAAPVFMGRRRAQRAHDLADRFGGSFAPLEDLDEHLATTDVLLCATASPHYVVTASALKRIAARRQRELVLIDLAVPRDIEPACRLVRGVTVHDLDDMQSVIDSTFADRESERVAAERIVEDEAERFGEWLLERRALSRTGQLLELFGDTRLPGTKQSSSA